MQDEQSDDIQQYLLSAGLIVCGLVSFVQVARFSAPAPKLWPSDKIFLGTGLVSLMGPPLRHGNNVAHALAYLVQ